MSKFTVHNGKRYRAIISLRWWEQIATNDKIAKLLRDVGFLDVDRHRRRQHARGKGPVAAERHDGGNSAPSQLDPGDRSLTLNRHHF